MRLSASPPDSFKQRSLLATWFVSPTPALRLGDKPLYCCLDPIICMYLSTVTLHHLIAFRETKGKKMHIYYFSFRFNTFSFLFFFPLSKAARLLGHYGIYLNSKEIYLAWGMEEGRL